MKIKAYQVDPEYQESPLFTSEFPDNIAICGNRDYNEHGTMVFDRVRSVLDNVANIIDNFEDWRAFYDSIEDVIKDYFPFREKPYTQEEIDKLSKLIVGYYYGTICDNDNVILCEILSIVDGKEWSYKQIHGLSQSEWNNVFYPVCEWDNKTLKCFEIEYFNTGSEWQIEYDSEDSISSTIYCTSQSDNEIKKEIAEVVGVHINDIELYAFNGYTKQIKYRKA